MALWWLQAVEMMVAQQLQTVKQREVWKPLTEVMLIAAAQGTQPAWNVVGLCSTDSLFQHW